MSQSLRERLVALADAMPSGTTERDRALVLAAARMTMEQDAKDCEDRANALNRATIESDMIGREVALAMVDCLRDRAKFIRLRADALRAQLDARGEGS